MKLLKRIAYDIGIISSEDYITKDKDYPTEQDWKDIYQESFVSLIKPIKNEIDTIIKQGVKDIISSKFRHYIHKNKDKNINELYEFVFNNIPYKYIWDNEIYNIEYEFFEQFSHMLSRGQVQNEFEQYVKEHFQDYIKSLIRLYKEENILTSEQQYNDNKYKENIYIRRPDQLVQLIDEVGDTIQLDNSFNINYKCRDSAFIFVIDQAYIGGSHYNLMQKYLQQHNITDNYYFNIDNIEQNKIPYAYGHIYRGIVLINHVYNITVEEVKNALLEKGKYRIYNYNTNDKILYRLACYNKE